MLVSTQSQGKNIFIIMNLVFVFITILLSKADSVSIDSSALTQEDVHLENSLCDMTPASSILDCAVLCSSHVDCLSFGFEHATQTCRQNVQNSATATNEMKEKKNRSRSNIALWIKRLWGPCSDHKFKKRDRCMDHVLTMALFCVKAEVSLMPGYCPVPAHMPNANITSGEQQQGSRRTYMCNHGYLDTSLDSTTAVTTCTTDGEWRKVQLNCSGPYIRMETPSQRAYIFTPIPPETLHDVTGNTSTLIFLTRTCRDSNFMLSEGSSCDNAMGKYRVIIGGWGNGKSAIFKCVRCGRAISNCPGFLNKIENSERGILSCKQFRPLWLSWKNGTISVGKGRIPGDQVLMKCMAPGISPVITISISSHKNNNGTWLFVPQT